jgi:hypothetical protein
MYLSDIYELEATMYLSSLPFDYLGLLDPGTRIRRPEVLRAGRRVRRPAPRSRA